jgi:putative spermidine/putrescine transport system ATP-binding protein
MDEPLGALDRRLRETLQLEFRRIHKELGSTFIYVTHDQEEALVMSDRIAVFKDGHIEQVASPAEMYENPRTLFVAEFLGDSNVITGRFENGALRAGDRRIAVPTPYPAKAGNASVVIRPEAVRVLTTAAAVPDGVNALSGTLREAVYMGSSSRLAIEVPGIGEFIATQPSRTERELIPGDEVVVTWNTMQSVLIPTDHDCNGESDSIAAGDRSRVIANVG